MSLRKNSLFISLGGGVRLLVNLAAIPLLMRLLGIDSYGVWMTINAQVGLFTLAELGISTALLSRLPGFLANRDKTGASQCLGTSLLMVTLFGMVASMTYLLLFPLMAKIFQGATQDISLPLSLRISSFLILPKILTLYLSSIEAAHQRYDLQAIVETLITVLLQAGVVVIAWKNGGLPNLLIWLLFTSLSGILTHTIIIRKILHVRFKGFALSKAEAGHQWRFGILHWVSSLGSSLFGQMDRILVTAILGSGAGGVYAAATSITTKINELSALPIKVITPAVSAEKENSNLYKIRSIYNKATRLNGAVMLLIALPIIFWSDLVSKIIVTADVACTFTSILPILASIYGVYSLGASGFFLMLGLGKPKINATWGIIGGLSLCAAMIPLAVYRGIIGAAWANAAYILVIVINLYGAKILEMPIGSYLLSLLRSAVVLLIWTVFSMLFPPENLAIVPRLLLFFGAGALSIFFAIGYSEIKDILAALRKRFSGRNAESKTSESELGK